MLRRSVMAGRPIDQSVYAVTGLYDAANANTNHNDSVANVSSCSGEAETMGPTLTELLGNKQKEFAQRREWRKGHQRSFSYDFNLAHRRDPSWRKGHERQASNDFQLNPPRDLRIRDWKRGHERHGSNISRKSLVAIASYNNAVRVAAENQPTSPIPPPPGSPSLFLNNRYVAKECGFGSCRPPFLQRFANIKIFVFLLSVIVTLQQAVSSGYLNSVITTIEKRFEIPSSLSGVIASTYEFGNLITIIFVSYLGSRRHIPVWIGIGCLVMGVGSMVFVLPHFLAGPYPITMGGKAERNLSEHNICRVQIREQQDEFQRGLGRLSSGLSSHLSSGNHMPGQRENCIDGDPSNALPVFIFMIAQLLLGCGGSPLFTLGTTYIDDHVKKESSAMYIGFMFSFGAFGPVCGFLLGAYLLSFHADSYMKDMGDFQSVDVTDPGWIGMWWGGFLICGILLMVWAVPFFAFPKELVREKEKVRMEEKSSVLSAKEHQPRVRSGSKHLSLPRQSQAEIQAGVETAGFVNAGGGVTGHQHQAQHQPLQQQPSLNNAGGSGVTGPSAAAVGSSCVPGPPVPSASAAAAAGPEKSYGKDIKDIPKSMWKLLSNSVYVVTCLGACMELVIVSGFLVFLPKYLETQFSLTKSQASVFTGGVAIPGASVGIFMGGFFLKRFQLGPKGALSLVISFNALCLACYSLLFFVGCDNALMAGTTLPYYFNANEASAKPSISPSPMPLKSGIENGGTPRILEVNLNAACNFGCACSPIDVEPVCGRNGVTYFSPCHAGCTSLSSRHNYSDCACILAAANPNWTGLAAAAADVTAVPVATAGPCPSPMCDAIMAFLVLLFFMTFVVAITQMPLLMIVLRSVEEEERSFALGMQFVIFRLFGYVPSPIMFGNVIDSTCIVWKEGACGGRSGRCLLYDIENFRYKFVGICLGIKIAAMLVFLMDYALVRRRYRREIEQATMTVGEIVSSIASLDKGFEEIADRAGIHSRRGSRTPSRLRGMSLCNDDERMSMLMSSPSSRPESPCPMFGSHDWLHLQHYRPDSVAYAVLNETPAVAGTGSRAVVDADSQGGSEETKVYEDSVFFEDADVAIGVADDKTA